MTVEKAPTSITDKSVVFGLFDRFFFVRLIYLTDTSVFAMIAHVTMYV